MENLPPQVIRCVSRELVDLSERPPDGIKVLLNEADVTDVQAAIEGPGERAPSHSCLLPCLARLSLLRPQWELRSRADFSA